ncbi:MAG TPA: hypothetical protein VMX75_11995, partial [Spirochaetia bacterium]|nr:hypothetical protein [Spirochaetia bacterium]
MCAVQNQPQVSLGTALELVDLAKTAVMGQSLEDLAGSILPTVRRMFEVPGALLYFADSRMASPCFFQHGLDPETVPGIERICSERYGLNSTHSGPQPAVIPDESAGNAAAKFLLYPLRENDSYLGLIGLMLQENLPHRLSEL